MQTISINSNELRVSLIPLGARIVDIEFSGHGLSLRYNRLDDYNNDVFYLGASVGPIANRIADASITIEGQHFSLPKNEGHNCLHSGGVGFDTKLWSLVEHTQSQAVFELSYDLADIGMVGILNTQAIYRIEGNQLNIEYRTRCDHTTYVNTTNHVYLNLSGHHSESDNKAINDHEFECYGDSYVIVDEQNIPTGQVTNFEAPLHCNINDSSPTAGANKEFEGHADHHFNVQNSDHAEQTTRMAKITSKISNIALEVFGNSPGYQLYTGAFLTEPFATSGGFCIETQCAPDAINQPGLFSPLLIKDQLRIQKTAFIFTHNN